MKSDYIPTHDNDLVTKKYVDALSIGFDLKESVRCATISNIDLSNVTSVDGVVLNNGDRVLVKNQTNAVDNGIYVFNSSTNSLTRASDFLTGSVTSGAFCFVEEGNVNKNTGWVLSTTGTIQVGTTSLQFVKFTSLTDYTAGNGIIISSGSISVNIGDNTLKFTNDGKLVVNKIGAVNIDTVDVQNSGDVLSWNGNNLEWISLQDTVKEVLGQSLTSLDNSISINYNSSTKVTDIVVNAVNYLKIVGLQNNRILTSLNDGTPVLTTYKEFYDSDNLNGDVNGTNVVFTTDGWFTINEMFSVYVNGVLQRKGLDYTYTNTGNVLTITFTEPPLVGDSITVCGYFLQNSHN